MIRHTDHVMRLYDSADSASRDVHTLPRTGAIFSPPYARCQNRWSTIRGHIADNKSPIIGLGITPRYA
jgi:hypothetical protein